jgi:hypothetical protein
MTTTLPTYVPRELVQERLLAIFPEGMPVRTYCVSPIAGSTVFAMLYVGAVNGTGRYLAPKHVYRMNDDQAALTSDAARLEYASETMKPRSVPRSTAWYADTTREPIRDETLRQGLMPTGAVTDKKDIPTTSSKPRYTLEPSFAGLFDPALVGLDLAGAIIAWQKAHLSTAALGRLELLRSGAVHEAATYYVTFPNGETRRLTPGDSSRITKAVIEEFTTRFLRKPAVLWVSESGNKVVSRDEILARRIGLSIDPAKHLPDIILVDLGDSSPDLVIVFVEVVATDGPISEQRRTELLRLATEGGHDEGNVAFVTAFLDRSTSAFRKCFPDLAWNSFVWVASEPRSLIGLFAPGEETTLALHEIVALSRRRNKGS